MYRVRPPTTSVRSYRVVGRCPTLQTCVVEDVTPPDRGPVERLVDGRVAVLFERFEPEFSDEEELDERLVLGCGV